MLKYLKQDWPSIVIYLAAGQVLLSANVNSLGWQFWAIYGLFVLHAYWIRTSEFSRYFQDSIEKCNNCVYMKNWSDAMFDDFRKKYNGLIDNELKQLSSATSTPEDTNQHDAKPPSP